MSETSFVSVYRVSLVSIDNILTSVVSYANKWFMIANLCMLLLAGLDASFDNVQAWKGIRKKAGELEYKILNKSDEISR